MARTKTITDTFIKNLKAPVGKDRHEEPITGYRGLVLRVTKTGHKSWIWYYNDPADGKRKKLTAPESYPGFGLADATAWATDHNAVLAKEGVVLDHKRAEEKAAKVAAEAVKAAEAVITLRYVWEEKYVGKFDPDLETQRLMNKNVLPRIGEQQIATITKRDLKGCVEALAERAPKSADRLVVNLKTFFKRVVAAWGEEFGMEHSVAEFLVKPDGSVGTRERVLSDSEIVLFFRAQSRLQDGDRVFADVLELLLEVGGRKREAMDMPFEEIDFSKGIWELPASRNKSGRDHLMLLPATVLERLKARRAINDKWVFGSVKDPSKHFNSARDGMEAVLAMMNKIAKEEGLPVVEGWSAHTLRHTFKTRLSEEVALHPHTVVNEDNIDRAQNHAVGSTIRRIYNKYGYLREKGIVYAFWQDMLEVWRAQARAAEAAAKLKKAA